MYILINGLNKGLVWFGIGFIASGLILAFIIIFSFSSINTGIENGLQSMSDSEMQEIFYNIAVSFINALRNTGFIFAGIGILILVVIIIKRENEQPDITAEGRNSEF